MKAKILELIDRIIGKKGMLWIPAYWMRNILSKILDWVEVVESKLDKSTKNISLIQGATFRVTIGNRGADITDENGNKYGYPAGINEIKFVKQIPRCDMYQTGRVDSIEIIGGVQNITSLEKAFYDYYRLTSIDIKALKMDNVKSVNNMFYRCTHITTLTFDTFANFSEIEDMSYMFKRCEALTTIEMGAAQKEIPNVKTMDNMFYNCFKLTSLGGFNYLKKTASDCAYTMKGTFFQCSALKAVNMNNLDVTNATFDYTTFDACSALTSVSFSTNSAINMSVSFSSCPLDATSIKNILTYCSKTTNTNAKTLTFKSGSTIADADGSVQTLIDTCTSKGWTVQNLTIS